MINSIKATIEGVEYNLVYNATSGNYESTALAPSTTSYLETDHVFGVSITATDEAGNSTTVDSRDGTFGTDLKLRVLETVAPTITMTYPSNSAVLTTSTPTITWAVVDSGSGVDDSTIALLIDDVVVTGFTKTAITGGYSCSYTPSSIIADGEHTIKLDVADNDGNDATQTVVTFKVDTVPPELNVTAPIAGLVTNQETITVTGSTNDTTSSPVTVSVVVNDEAAITTTVGDDGTFSQEITLDEGENTIVITTTDSAGKDTTITRTVTLDTVAPVFTGVTITPNPVDCGATFIISVTATD